MDAEVEGRIGGKWGTVKFLGHSDSNIDFLRGIGYVVHEYIHTVTGDLMVRRSVNASAVILVLTLATCESQKLTRGYNFQHNRRMYEYELRGMELEQNDANAVQIGAIDRR